MKQISLIVNAILILAVAFLYFHIFSKDKKTNAVPGQTITASQSSSPAAPIAYVELDSLHENITYIKNIRKDLEAEQRRIETEWERGIRGLEKERDAFVQRKEPITQQEAEAFQMKLMTENQKIEERKQAATQKLSEKSYKFMEEIQKNLKAFLETYNQEKKYMYIFTAGTGLDYMVYKDSAYNITNEVIVGMNERMNAATKKK